MNSRRVSQKEGNFIKKLLLIMSYDVITDKKKEIHVKRPSCFDVTGAKQTLMILTVETLLLVVITQQQQCYICTLTGKNYAPCFRLRKAYPRMYIYFRPLFFFLVFVIVENDRRKILMSCSSRIPYEVIHCAIWYGGGTRTS